MWINDYCAKHTAHYQTQEMTYFEHLKHCTNLSWLSIKVSATFLIHGLLPGCFRRCGSTAVSRMNEKCNEVNRRC